VGAECRVEGRACRTSWASDCDFNRPDRMTIFGTQSLPRTSKGVIGSPVAAYHPEQLLPNVNRVRVHVWFVSSPTSQPNPSPRLPFPFSSSPSLLHTTRSPYCTSAPLPSKPPPLTRLLPSPSSSPSFLVNRTHYDGS